MKTNGEFLKELAMNQNLTVKIKLKDLNELKENVKKLEERNRLLEQNVTNDRIRNELGIKDDSFITSSDINKYFGFYYRSAEDEQDRMDRLRAELGIRQEQGLWPNGECIPLELSGLKVYDIYIYNALKRAGIKYIEELKDKTYEWFASLHYIGKGRADKLQDCLYRTWGFKLKEE